MCVRQQCADYSVIRLVDFDRNELVPCAMAVAPGRSASALLMTLQDAVPLTSEYFTARAFRERTIVRYGPAQYSPRVTALLQSRKIASEPIVDLYPICSIDNRAHGVLLLVTSTAEWKAAQLARDTLAAEVTARISAWCEDVGADAARSHRSRR